MYLCQSKPGTIDNKTCYRFTRFTRKPKGFVAATLPIVLRRGLTIVDKFPIES